ncbi:MAG: DUF4926 domain-containing protein [Gemmatimonadetes bacterium]|nr:DUF4926 domain-containing protein [Gemmatimonadota bacterium]
MIPEHASVVLTRDIPEHDLEQGDVGVVVHLYPGGAIYEVEFMTADGTTIAVLTLSEGDIRLPDEAEMLHIRKLPVQDPS